MLLILICKSKSGQTYTVFSRVKTYGNLYYIGKCNKSEYEYQKQNRFFPTIKRNTILDDNLKILVHNVRSLSKLVDDIGSDNRMINNVMVSEDRMINNDIIGFTETQINPSDSTCKIVETLIFFNIN